MFLGPRIAEPRSAIKLRSSSATAPSVKVTKVTHENRSTIPAVIRLAISLSAVLTVSLIACNGHPSLEVKPEARPEAKLVGKWEEVTPPKGRIPVQFEFFTDGTVIENDRVVLLKQWRQLGAGSFKFMDATRIKVELQPNWYFGVVIYEVVWQDQDHVTLRAGDRTIQLTRVKPAEAH